jgi:glutaredoxin
MNRDTFGRPRLEPSQAIELEDAMTTLLSRLLSRPETRKAAHLTFTVYSRAACGCCDKAMKVLKESQRRFGFIVDEVDIDHDPDLVAKYNTEVPVVTVNGKVRFRGVVSPALLERLLVAESRQSGSSVLMEDSAPE